MSCTQNIEYYLWVRTNVENYCWEVITTFEKENIYKETYLKEFHSNLDLEEIDSIYKISILTI